MIFSNISAIILKFVFANSIEKATHVTLSGIFFLFFFLFLFFLEFVAKSGKIPSANSPRIRRKTVKFYAENEKLEIHIRKKMLTTFG